MDSDNDDTVNAADAAVEDEGSGVIIPVNEEEADNDALGGSHCAAAKVLLALARTIR